MDVGLVERMLRGLPGVLDCSVSDEGIAVVVHPEVDPRLLELRAQTALAEIGERRPLLVVGGMTAAAGAGPGGAAPRGVQRVARNRSSTPVIGFAVLVVAALTVLPLAGRDTSTIDDTASEASAPPLAPPPAVGRSSALPSFGPLPVTDERLMAALGPVSASPAGAATHVVRFVRRAAHAAPAATPVSAPAAPAVDVGTASPVVPAPVPLVAAERGKSTGRGKSVAFTAAADSGGAYDKAGSRKAKGKAARTHEPPKPHRPAKTPRR